VVGLLGRVPRQAGYRLARAFIPPTPQLPSALWVSLGLFVWERVQDKWVGAFVVRGEFWGRVPL
jgi:hypothetical protein